MTKVFEPPMFPLIRPTEKEAMIEYNSLRGLDAACLLQRKEWKSRSVFDESFARPYTIGRSLTGNKTSNFYHWQARVACDSLNSPSPIRSWYDKKLRKSIESSVYYQQSHKSALTMRGYVPSQFRPSAAKCLYTVFQARKIYDPCGGWGDRLLGAMSHDCEFYLCRDVNPLVFTGYALQQQSLPTKARLAFEYKGSEIDCPAPHYFDFIFTSPPYYKLEKYQGDGQSHRKYKVFDEWLANFLFPMVSFAWEALEENGVLALNISDCYANHTYNRICQPLIDYCLTSLERCSMQGVIGYEIISRKKNGADAEPVLFFTKGDRKIEWERLVQPPQIQMCFPDKEEE